MPLDNIFSKDWSPDGSGLKFDPQRDVNGEALRAVACFPAEEVAVVWYDEKGELAAPIPVPGRRGQRANMGQVYAPGISPMALVRVDFDPNDQCTDERAMARVTYQLYQDGEHVGTPEDELVRRHMIALARAAYGGLMPREMEKRDLIRERDLADKLFDTVQENNIREHVAIRLLAAAYALRRGQQGLDDAGQLVRDMIRRIEDGIVTAEGYEAKSNEYYAGAVALRAWLTEAFPPVSTIDDSPPF